MDLVSSEEAEQSLAGPDWNDVATASYHGSDDDNDIVPRSDDEQPSQTYDLSEASESHRRRTTSPVQQQLPKKKPTTQPGILPYDLTAPASEAHTHTHTHCA